MFKLCQITDDWKYCYNRSIMKILCDVHISIKVAKLFVNKGIVSMHVNDILDKWFTTDIKICEYADEHDFTVITKDTDFKNSHFINHSPKKLIKINH